jgi:hypothetical protein
MMVNNETERQSKVLSDIHFARNPTQERGEKNGEAEKAVALVLHRDPAGAGFGNGIQINL